MRNELTHSRLLSFPIRLLICVVATLIVLPLAQAATPHPQISFLQLTSPAAVSETAAATIPLSITCSRRWLLHRPAT
jgi:hypothetical protein